MATDRLHSGYWVISDNNTLNDRSPKVCDMEKPVEVMIYNKNHNPCRGWVCPRCYTPWYIIYDRCRCGYKNINIDLSDILVSGDKLGI